ncbi:MAG: transposase [bacterium]
MNLVPSFKPLLQVFSAEMSSPTFQTFYQIIIGWFFASQHLISQAIFHSGNARIRHHASFYRVFSCAAWDINRVGWNTCDRIFSRFYRSSKIPIELVIDDTNARKCGRKVFGTGWHYDPLSTAPNKKQSTWAHNWVVLTVLVHPFRDSAKRVAMTIQSRLYISLKTAQKKKLAYCTKTGLALEMLQILCDKYPNRMFHLLVDAAYGVSDMIAKLPSNCHMTSRLRCDSRFYRLFKPVEKQGRGRPRKRGKAMEKATVLFQNRVKTSRELTLYGRPTKVQWVTFKACLYETPERELRIVVVQFPETKGKKIPKLVTLYSTNLGMSAQEVVESYCRRWSIEETFQEAKGHLGFEEPRSWSEMSVRRLAPTILILHSLLWLWASREKLNTRTVNMKLPWNRKTEFLSMTDILQIMREKQVKEIIKSTQNDGPKRKKRCKYLQYLIPAAA